MATIDERVVAMSFENTVFEQRAARTMATLGKLDTAVKGMGNAKGLEGIEKSADKVQLKGPMKALDMLKTKLGRSGEGAAQGLGDIEKAGNKVTLEGPTKALDKTQAKMDQLSAGKTFADIEKASQQVELSGISKAVDSVSGKFGMLEQAASVAMGNITSQAVMKGGAFAKSFAMGPVTQGFDEYQTNMKSIQTIMANTEGQAVSGLPQVNKHLEELNHYSDQTIYNFSEMAKNIGTFTAAGVSLPESTKSIKGIANLAAISGSNSQQASTAMYQLSQAISSGKVGLQDWNSVVNAGMGGAVFQKSLMRTAENMGTVEKGAVKIDKATGKATVNGESFRNSIMAKPGKESWLTSDVLTNTLSQLTGDMTEAELAAQGFSGEQVKLIMKQAETAKKAATEVKTLPEVWDVARETIGSGWSKTFQLIFGDFEESKKLFTNMSTFINDWLGKVSDGRNKMITDWKELGGRDELLAGLKKAFQNFAAILKPIGDAFRKIFPPKSGDDLEALTARFVTLMDKLAPSQDLIDHIRRIFAGLFSIMHIGWNITKGLIGVFFDLFSTAGKGSGGFLELVADLGDWLVAADKALTQGDLLKNFFEILGSVVKKPMEWISKLADAIGGLFHEGHTTQMRNAVGQIVVFGDELSPLEKLVNKLKDAWATLVDWFGKAKSALEPWFSSFVGTISNLGSTIGDALSKLSFDDVLKGVNTGLMAGLVLMLKNAFGKGGGVMDSISDTLGAVQDMLGGVTGNLENMQRKVQAQLILAIAAAVLALAAGVYVLSTIDGDKLSKAMLAVAIGLGQLIGAMKIMASGMGVMGALMLPVIAAGLIGLAIAVVILGAALKIMATMSWEEIGKGLTAMGGALGTIAVAMKLMPKGPQMVIQAAALLILGVALNAIAGAIKILGGMDLNSLGKGLFGVMEALGVLALTMGMMPPNMLVSAIALGVISLALGVMAGAIKKFGEMDFLVIVQGILGVTAAIAGIAVAMLLMPPNMIATAAGLVLVGFALIGIGKAVEIMGGMGIWSLIKGLGALAGVMIILAAGLYLMTGTLPGSVALLAAAAALAVLAPTIALLGNLKWSTIFKGIASIALALGTIAIVGLVAAPALGALGIALIPLGLGFMLVAGAAKIFASAMAMLSESGQKGIATFLVALTGFVAIIPTIVIQFIKGLVGIVEEIAKIAPKVFEALSKVLETVIQFVTDNAVKLAVAVGLLIDGILLVIVENVPKIIDAGRKLLLALLSGISADIGAITTKVSEIIIKFMDALRAKTPQLVDSGAKLLRTFLDGVGSKFGEIARSVGNLIEKFGNAVGSQAHKIVGAAANMMGRFIDAIGTYGPKLLAKGGQMIRDLLDGLGREGPKLIDKGVEVAGKLLQGIADGLVGLAKMGFDAIISFLNGLEDTIREKSTELVDAGLGVGDAIMDGISQAFGRGGPAIKKALDTVFNALPGWAKKALKIQSPSKVFHEIGMFTMAGFQKGIEEGTIKSRYVMVDIGKQSAKGMAKGLKDNKGEVAKESEDVGKYSAKGMAKGMGDNKKVVAKAAIDSAKELAKAAKFFLGIHSPSEVFREIGKNVNRGFRDGLLGSREQVLEAFTSMNETLIEKIRELRTTVADENKKIRDLQKQHAEKLAEIREMQSKKKQSKEDKEEIAEAIKEAKDLAQQIREETAVRDANSRSLTTARNARAALTGAFKDEKMALAAAAQQYEDLSKAIDKATQTLDEATAARDESRKSLTEQYSKLPDYDNLVSEALANAELSEEERREKVQKAKETAEKKRKIDQVALYKKALADQIAAVKKYNETLQKLRALGLDDTTYKMLLAKGTEGQAFADQLAAGGARSIAEVKNLNGQLTNASEWLGYNASQSLYQAGVDAAQGFLDGLKVKEVNLKKYMEDMADWLVKALRAKLGIKSPSKVLAEVGKYAVLGLAKGLNDTSPLESAAVNLGRTMTDALASVVSDNMDANPVITPVLDISQLEKDVAGMPGLGNVIPITAATSYGQASATSQEVSATQQAAVEAAAAMARPSVMFEQNNYSPEALSDVEIYRKTKNQIGQLKSALGVPA